MKNTCTVKGHLRKNSVLGELDTFLEKIRKEKIASPSLSTDEDPLDSSLDKTNIPSFKSPNVLEETSNLSSNSTIDKDYNDHRQSLDNYPYQNLSNNISLAGLKNLSICLQNQPPIVPLTLNSNQEKSPALILNSQEKENIKDKLYTNKVYSDHKFLYLNTEEREEDHLLSGGQFHFIPLILHRVTKDRDESHQKLDVKDIRHQLNTQAKVLYFRLESIDQDEITLLIKHKGSEQESKTTILQFEHIDVRELARKHKQSLFLQNNFLKANLNFSVFIPNLVSHTAGGQMKKKAEDEVFHPYKRKESNEHPSIFRMHIILFHLTTIFLFPKISTEFFICQLIASVVLLFVSVSKFRGSVYIQSTVIDRKLLSTLKEIQDRLLLLPIEQDDQGYYKNVCLPDFDNLDNDLIDEGKLILEITISEIISIDSENPEGVLQDRATKDSNNSETFKSMQSKMITFDLAYSHESDHSDKSTSESRPQSSHYVKFYDSSKKEIEGETSTELYLETKELNVKTVNLQLCEEESDMNRQKDNIQDIDKNANSVLSINERQQDQDNEEVVPNLQDQDRQQLVDNQQDHDKEQLLDDKQGQNKQEFEDNQENEESQQVGDYPQGKDKQPDKSIPSWHLAYIPILNSDDDKLGSSKQDEENQQVMYNKQDNHNQQVVENKQNKDNQQVDNTKKISPSQPNTNEGEHIIPSPAKTLEEESSFYNYFSFPSMTSLLSTRSNDDTNQENMNNNRIDFEEDHFVKGLEFSNPLIQTGFEETTIEVSNLILQNSQDGILLNHNQETVDNIRAYWSDENNKESDSETENNINKLADDSRQLEDNEHDYDNQSREDKNEDNTDKHLGDNQTDHGNRTEVETYQQDCDKEQVGYNKQASDSNPSSLLSFIPRFSQDNEQTSDIQDDEDVEEVKNDNNRCLYEADHISNRFIIDCFGDLGVAKERWLNTIAWRKEKKIDEINEFPHPNFDTIKKHFAQFVTGTAKNGYPVYYELTGRAEIGTLRRKYNISIDEMVWHVAWFSEYCYNKIVPDDDARIVMIIDIAGVSMFTLFETIEFVVKLLSLIQVHYPEKAEVIMIVNIPSWFPYIWNLVKYAINENTAKRLKFIPEEDIYSEMSKYIDQSQIPPAFGGTLKYNNESIEDDPFCRFSSPYELAMKNHAHQVLKTFTENGGKLNDKSKIYEKLV